MKTLQNSLFQKQVFANDTATNFSQTRTNGADPEISSSSNVRSQLCVFQQCSNKVIKMGKLRNLKLMLPIPYCWMQHISTV